MALRLTMMPDGDMANGRSGNGICLRHTTDRPTDNHQRWHRYATSKSKWDIVELSPCETTAAFSVTFCAARSLELSSTSCRVVWKCDRFCRRCGQRHVANDIIRSVAICMMSSNAEKLMQQNIRPKFDRNIDVPFVDPTFIPVNN